MRTRRDGGGVSRVLCRTLFTGRFATTISRCFLVFFLLSTSIPFEAVVFSFLLFPRNSFFHLAHTHPLLLSPPESERAEPSATRVLCVSSSRSPLRVALSLSLVTTLAPTLCVKVFAKLLGVRRFSESERRQFGENKAIFSASTTRL